MSRLSSLRCTESTSEENINSSHQGNMASVKQIMESSDAINTSTTCRLQTSQCSNISNESDISLLSLSLDKEMESYTNNGVDIDELPAFEIRLISPLGRTPSPIDSEDMATPTRSAAVLRLTPSPCGNNPEFVALQDINAQISPPSECEKEDDEGSILSRTSSLETIFEGIFLNTPPRQRRSILFHHHSRSRTNLLEKVALNRLQAGKENQSPSSKPPSRRSSLEFSPTSAIPLSNEDSTS